jgi:hypothetical protein
VDNRPQKQHNFCAYKNGPSHIAKLILLPELLGVIKSYNKCGISNAIHGTDNVLFGESESSDNNNSSDEYDSDDKDFRGFNDQHKLHTTQPFC